MRASTLTRALLAVAVAFALGACAEQAATPATTPAEASPAASTPAVATAVAQEADRERAARNDLDDFDLPGGASGIGGAGGPVTPALTPKS